MTRDNAGRPAALLVGVSVTGLSQQRAAAVAALAAGLPTVVPVWRHVAAAGAVTRALGTAPHDGTEPQDGTEPRDGIDVLPAVVGVRLDELADGFRPAGQRELPVPSVLVLPVSYGTADVVLDRLRGFAGTRLGVHMPVGSDRELRQFGVTSDQALGDWLGAARGVGFSAVALWPVVFTIAGLAPREFDTAARHVAQLAAMLAPVPR